MFRKILLLVTFFQIATLSYADEIYLNDASSVLRKNRSSTIVDISGEKTDLLNIEFKPEGRYDFRFSFPPHGSSFVVIRKSVDLTIPLNMIFSINFNGKNCEVKYQFMGQNKSVSGKYLSGEFVGGSDFGSFKIKSDKVKEIVFTKKPIKVNPPILNSTLVLNDGESFLVRDLRIIDLFIGEGHSLYINWAPTNTFVHKETEVIFKKGESLISVPFGKISEINVLPEKKTFIVKLKSGKHLNGTYLKFDEKQEGTIDGFSGVSNEGGFFVNIEYIKRVEFNTKQ